MITFLTNNFNALGMFCVGVMIGMVLGMLLFMEILEISRHGDYGD